MRQAILFPDDVSPKVSLIRSIDVHIRPLTEASDLTPLAQVMYWKYGGFCLYQQGSIGGPV
ncbi:MAG: hypothetical protein AB2L24_34105 [Mangrovibacterium sp.]